MDKRKNKRYIKSNLKKVTGGIKKAKRQLKASGSKTKSTKRLLNWL